MPDVHGSCFPAWLLQATHGKLPLQEPAASEVAVLAVARTAANLLELLMLLFYSTKFYRQEGALFCSCDCMMSYF